ncbi:MAG: dTDP-4-dehydrorhamnose 3,5-epimerase [Gemmatimonas sp.]
MRIQPTRLDGVFTVEIVPLRDSRGYFARTFCVDEFKAAGLNPAVVQCNVSVNDARGTVRGMHFQRPPHAEAKLVRVVAGALYDVAVDVRPASPTFGEWVGVELTAENGVALYVGEGFAHGFQTLADRTQVLYNMSEFYHPESSVGFRWNDAAVGVRWPLPDAVVISEKDAALPPLADVVRR